MLILMILFFAVFETAVLIRDDMYLQRVAREAAREAALTGNLYAGYAKGRDMAAMYFSGKNVTISLDQRGSGRNAVVVARAEMFRPFLGGYTERLFGERGIKLGSVATYAWHDRAEGYVD